MDVSNQTVSQMWEQPWPIRVLLCAMLAMMAGCPGDDPARPSSSDPTPITDTLQATPEPPEVEDSPERHAAESAFRKMTTENISEAEWEAAVQTLQTIGEPSLPVLVDGLKSQDAVKREMASTVLAWFGVEAQPVAEQLIPSLNDESVFVRANVATALLQMPEHVDRVVPVLSEYLQSDDPDMRRMAATNLAALEADAARPLLPQLVAVLDDPDRDVVYYCVQLLGRIGPDAQSAVPKLRALDTSDDAELKSAVTTALYLIDPDSEPELPSP